MKLKMYFQRAYLIFILASAAFIIGCLSKPTLGEVNNTTYTSKRGEFTVPFPYSSSIGGRVAGDDENGVTFKSNMAGAISCFYVLPINKDPELEKLLQTNKKETLMEATKKFYSVSNVHYHPEVKNGAVSFVFFKEASKRYCGTAIFLSDRNIFIVETEPALAMELLGGWEKKKREEIDPILEKQALELLATIQVN